MQFHGGVYRSDDRGDNWTRISGDLPNMPVNDLVVDNLDLEHASYLVSRLRACSSSGARR